MEPALNLKGEKVTVSLNWVGNTDLPDLTEIRSQNDDLLSYELQIKAKEDIQGSRGDHYMLGLSFRLNTATDSTYGISFFRSIGRGDVHRPGWIDDLNPVTFKDDVMNGDRYIVLWEKLSGTGTYSLLDYGPDPEVIEETIGELKPWPTIIVQIFESKEGGVRKNTISGYIQGTSSYSRNTINWNYNNFKQVLFNVEDDSLKSETFETPAEIGLHACYDSPANNDQFLDDFAMRILNNDGSAFIKAIQY